MRILTGREASLIAIAISLSTPSEEGKSPHRNHLEHKAERTASGETAVQLESAVRPAKAVKPRPRFLE